jgi:molybdopterin-containing oxidoreductase family iron-sulfur binding subunit
MNETSEHTDLNRREFLTRNAVTAGVALAPGVMLYSVAQARPADEPVSSAVRWGLLIDTNKCASGCSDCVSACERENGWGTGSTDESHSDATQKAQWIRKVEVKNTETGHAFTLPMMCQHCENPPCVDVCPTGASFRRDDGIVLVDKHICIPAARGPWSPAPCACTGSTQAIPPRAWRPARPRITMPCCSVT